MLLNGAGGDPPKDDPRERDWGPDLTIVPPKEPMSEGMYFGLDEAAYHSDPSLGSHDVMNLLKTSMDYWANSWMNPVPDDRDVAAALDWGKAAHKLVLEGWDAFQATYAVKPDRDAFRAAGGLVTIEDLKRFCAEEGLVGKGLKSKDDWVRLASSHPEKKASIYDVVVASIEAAGKSVIDEKMYNEVIIASQMIRRNPHIKDCFTHGFPEVSFFWREEVVTPSGEIVVVPCKGRIDWLKVPRTVDFKTIAPNSTMPFETAVERHIWGYRYDVQCAHYQRGRERARHLAKAGKVFFGLPGRMSTLTEAEHARIERFLPHFVKQAKFSYSWVFLQKGRAPVAKGIDMEEWAMASSRRERALQVYAQNWLKHGSSMWIYDKPVHVLTEADAPPWVGESEALG